MDDLAATLPPVAPVAPVAPAGPALPCALAAQYPAAAAAAKDRRDRRSMICRRSSHRHKSQSLLPFVRRGSPSNIALGSSVCNRPMERSARPYVLIAHEVPGRVECATRVQGSSAAARAAGSSRVSVSVIAKGGAGRRCGVIRSPPVESETFEVPRLFAPVDVGWNPMPVGAIP